MPSNTFYNEVLTDHNLHPGHKHDLPDANLVLEGVNPNCGDDIFLKLKLHTHIAYDKKAPAHNKRNVSVPFFHRNQSSAHIYADCEKTLQPLFFDAQSPHPNIKYFPQEQPFRGRAPAI